MKKKDVILLNLLFYNKMCSFFIIKKAVFCFRFVIIGDHFVMLVQKHQSYVKSRKFCPGTCKKSDSTDG